MNALPVLGLALAAAIATMLGGLFALSLNRCRGPVAGFSAGAVLGVALFDLVPEAIKLGGGAGAMAASGALVFLGYGVFDRLVAHHGRGAARGAISAARGLVGAGGFSLHSLMDGLGIGLAIQAGHGVGLVVASAVVAHDFADGLNTVNVVVKNGGSGRKAFAWLLTDAAAPLLGAGLSLFVVLPANMLAVMLAGFAGFFFYVGALDLLPESQRLGPRIAAGLATMLAAGLMYVLSRATF